MKREITCYETNNLDTLKFISWCKYFLDGYTQHKLMLLPLIAKEIWKMIQKDVFNVNTYEISFNKIVNEIGYDDFMVAMYTLCYAVRQNEKDYIYSINCEDKDCVSLIGEPIYKFLNKIEELLPYED